MVEEELVQYIIVNEDLVDADGDPVKMSAGKLAVLWPYHKSDLPSYIRRLQLYK